MCWPINPQLSAFLSSEDIAIQLTPTVGNIQENLQGISYIWTYLFYLLQLLSPVLQTVLDHGHLVLKVGDLILKTLLLGFVGEGALLKLGLEKKAIFSVAVIAILWV